MPSDTSLPPTSTPAPPTPGAFDPGAIALSAEPLADGFRSLTFVTNAGDGSGALYVVEQAGRISTISASGGSAQPFLDISERVHSGGEQGLLGLAFHPDFEANGRFFVDYTDTHGDTVVSEFVRPPDGVLDTTAERVLLHVNQPFSNHNGGMLAFGPDGYLYIGLGDGGSGGDPNGNGQNPATLLATILRIDVDSGDPYAIPPDNPFANGAGGARPEVWDYGLRNPWRFSFDRLTGGLFIGDVGQDTREEIDAEPAGSGGRNYGWNIMEGDQCYGRSTCARGGLTPPAAAYGRDENCAVTGGYVYRGSPVSGALWRLRLLRLLQRQAVGPRRAARLSGAQPRVYELGRSGLGPSSFGEDEAGELYIVDHSGSIYRLVASTR